MTEIPNLAIGLVEALEHKGKCYSTMIHMLGTRSASERLAQMLLLLAERDGRRTDAGIVIARRLTHDGFAKMVGDAPMGDGHDGAPHEPGHDRHSQDSYRYPRRR